MTPRNLSIVGLLVALALFFAVNIAGSAVLKSARVDLTDNGLYTLTRGSRNIARAVDEPIRFTLYFTSKSATGLPGIKSYAQRVQEILEEYERLSGGRIRLTVVDPEPFSEAEDEATASGVAGVPLGTGERLFFGLVGRNATGDTKVVPFFQAEKEQFLEYDLTKLIYALMSPKKPAIGVMTHLPLKGTDMSQFDPRMQQERQPPWQIYAQLKEVFEIKDIEPAATELSAGLDVLLVIHPKNLSDATLYAIDQYVVGGGKLIVAVDPNCEFESPPPMQLQAAISANKASNLTKLFDAWGVTMAGDRVAGDRQTALMVNMGGNPSRPETVSYACWMRLTRDNLNKDDAVAGQFSELILATAGVLDKKPGEQTNPELVYTPIIQTSPEAMRVPQARVQFMPQANEILAEYVPGNERLTLAARLSGKLKSAFAEAPKDPNTPDAPPPAKPHIAQAAEPVNILVFTDVDFLTDRFWVRQDQFLGQMVYSKLSDNGDLVLSAVDHLTGSQDLISVRARGQYTRPFTRVQAIQKKAEQEHLTQQKKLDDEIREAEKRIAEIQRQRPDQAAAGVRIILTPAQQEEIEKLQRVVLATRKEKRQVELNMRRDIERLGTTLKVVNAAVVPVAVCGLALGLGMYRTSRRRADRARISRGPS